MRAVDGVSLEIRDGEFFSLLGPSGSGKTTTLRMIAGFERPDAGEILLHGRDVSRLAPCERDVNTVFQDYAHPTQTFRRVLWPLAFPGVVAGSIFTFSLTLSDDIVPIIGDSSPFIGLAIYDSQGVAGNLPLAAAFSFIPMVIMAVYLLVARRLGAFEAL